MNGQRLPACGVILAGGRSSRMGQNKALLHLQGETLVARQARKFQAWFQQTVLVTNEPERYQALSLPMVPDRHPGGGPLAGIEAGLGISEFPWAFVAAVDLPFLERGLVDRLWVNTSGHLAVVPRPQGQWEPTCAFYHRDCRPVISEMLEAGRQRAYLLYETVAVKAVEGDGLAGLPADRLFFNVNTPSDLAQAESWAY